MIAMRCELHNRYDCDDCKKMHEYACALIHDLEQLKRDIEQQHANKRPSRP